MEGRSKQQESPEAVESGASLCSSLPPVAVVLVPEDALCLSSDVRFTPFGSPSSAFLDSFAPFIVFVASLYRHSASKDL